MRRDDHASDTRRALLEAARERFAEGGFAGASLETIVAQARVTTGAVYHHFGGKRGLFRAVVAQLQREMTERLIAEAQNSGQLEDDLWSAIQTGFATFVAASMEAAYLRIVVLEAPVVLGHDDAQGLAEDGYGPLARHWIQEAIDHGVVQPLPVDPLVQLMGGLLGHAALIVARADDPQRARGEVQQVLDALLASLRRAT